MRSAAVDLEQHPEAAAVQGVEAGPPGELGDRLGRDEGERLDVHAARGDVRLHEPDRPAAEVAEGVAPRPADESALDAVSPEVGDHGLAERDFAVDDPAVREGERETVRGRVPLGADERERAVVEPGQQPPVLPDQVEAAVAGGAEELQLDLVGVVELKALDRGGGDANQRRHGYPAGGGSAWPHASAPPSTTTVVPVTYEAAGEARKAMTAATSSGVPRRPAGIERSHAAICSAP